MRRLPFRRFDGATTNKVYDVQKEMQMRMRDLYSSSPDALKERAPQLAALYAEAETKVTALLGARGYEAYKQYGGSWMRSLQPPPAPKK